jgi:hypothetical protein
VQASVVQSWLFNSKRGFFGAQRSGKCRFFRKKAFLAQQVAGAFPQILQMQPFQKPRSEKAQFTPVFLHKSKFRLKKTTD